MSESWYPYWSWEHYQHGFFEKDLLGMGKNQCEQIRKDFFLSDGLFRDTAIKVMQEWPVCSEHFLTGSKINPVAFIGQVSAFYLTGVGHSFSYAYNQLPRSVRELNNKIAKDLIGEWLSERESGTDNKLYKVVEKERLQEGYTSRVPEFFKHSRASTILQGDLFGDP